MADYYCHKCQKRTSLYGHYDFNREVYTCQEPKKTSIDPDLQLARLIAAEAYETITEKLGQNDQLANGVLHWYSVHREGYLEGSYDDKPLVSKILKHLKRKQS